MKGMTKEQFMAIVGSKPVIAIDQDPLGIQGRNVSTAAGGSAGKEVWSKPLKGGAVAVLLMNAAPGKKGKGPALSISLKPGVPAAMLS